MSALSRLSQIRSSGSTDQLPVSVYRSTRQSPRHRPVAELDAHVIEDGVVNLPVDLVAECAVAWLNRAQALFRPTRLWSAMPLTLGDSDQRLVSIQRLEPFA